MSKPRVGLTALVSSPLRCFKMVVFPALSSPLGYVVEVVKVVTAFFPQKFGMLGSSSQKEESHFFRLSLILPYDSEESCDLLSQANRPIYASTRC